MEKNVLEESIAWLLRGIWHVSLSPTSWIHAFHRVLENLETLHIECLPFEKKGPKEHVLAVCTMAL